MQLKVADAALTMAYNYLKRMRSLQPCVILMLLTGALFLSLCGATIWTLTITQSKNITATSNGPPVIGYAVCFGVIFIAFIFGVITRCMFKEKLVSYARIAILIFLVPLILLDVWRISSGSRGSPALFFGGLYDLSATVSVLFFAAWILVPHPDMKGKSREEIEELPLEVQLYYILRVGQWKVYFCALTMAVAGLGKWSLMASGKSGIIPNWVYVLLFSLITLCMIQLGLGRCWMTTMITPTTWVLLLVWGALFGVDVIRLRDLANSGLNTSQKSLEFSLVAFTLVAQFVGFFIGGFNAMIGFGGSSIPLVQKHHDYKKKMNDGL